MPKRIAMIGAGSGFTVAIAEGLIESSLLADSEFVLVDTDRRRLDAAAARVEKLVTAAAAPLRVTATVDRRQALAGCDYVVTSCETRRLPYWIRDLELPQQFGVHQFKGENGGPGGQAHAMRNITLFMDICRDLEELCPAAWLMNFTNPMSFLCTYFHRYTKVKALGFCHQVHGSFGVIAEMLGLPPGELEVISAGVNHFNWLLDLRRRGSRESWLDEFLTRVRQSEYWQQVHRNMPAQRFTLDVLETFGLYPIGYDDHIIEYLPFFYDHTEWQALGYQLEVAHLREQLAAAEGQSLARAEFHDVPFPRDPAHPHYSEKPTAVMVALETNEPLYMTAMVIPNDGAVETLPREAIVDVPAVVVGGEARSVHVGPLPTFANELCRRQITIHELLTQATVEGDRQKVTQAMALDPYVSHIRQARDITDAFLAEYRAELPQFWR